MPEIIEVEDERLWLGGRLQEVYDAFDRWMHIQDKKIIDLTLALALSRKLEGTTIWIILIGPSGDGKSEIVMAFHDNENSVLLHELTPNTLVSGYSEGEKRFDLAPELDKKLVIIPDMAQILHLHPNDKAKVWAQLRELYDGRAGRRTGSSRNKSYEGLRVTILACSTPAIDNQILVFTHLGTRELLYRTDLDRKIDNDALIGKVLENEKGEKIMREELRDAVKSFLAGRKVFDKHPISEEVMAKIKAMVHYLRYMRATADTDSYTGELINIAYPEQPTRSLKQLVRLFRCLKSLDPSYSDGRALEVLEHVVKSSVLPIREGIMMLLKDAKDRMSTSKIAEELRLGKKTAFRELNILWNIKLVERETDEFDPKGTYYWKINEHGKSLMKWVVTR